MLKTIRLLRNLSSVLFLGILTLVYAYLPVMVRLDPEGNFVELHRSDFFYYAIGVFLVINIITWALTRLGTTMLAGKRSEDSVAWFNALPVLINFYLTLLAGFIGVFNNPGVSYAKNFAYLNYIGPVLIFVWLFGFIYLLNRKIGDS